MIHDSQLPELSAFRAAEQRLPFATSDSLANTVAPQANESSPVHRWFRFKESFSATFVRATLQEIAKSRGRNLHMLDPFCGVGTSLVAAQQCAAEGLSVSVTGIEYNPFIHFVAETKANWRAVDTSELLRMGGEILRQSVPHVQLPRTDSITSGRCISRHVARRLITLRELITRNATDGTRSAALLGLASAIESVSRTRKDGRALRIVERPKIRVTDAVWDRWQTIADDVAFLQATIPTATTARVVRGDGRRPTTAGILPESIDVIITSPPYPNNIDYTEVYKLELWLLGMVSTSQEFLTLRQGTFRSHPTTRATPPTSEFLRAAKSGQLRRILWPLIERTSAMASPWRGRLLIGYFEDLYSALQEYLTVLKRGGVAIFVVGNSLHGGQSDPYLIPTDLVLAELARHVGFEVESLAVARAFRRRLSGNHFLRESVVTIRKANA